MGEEFEVTIEKGKTLAIKTLTPGIEVKFVCFFSGGGEVWYSISFLLGYFRVEFKFGFNLNFLI